MPWDQATMDEKSGPANLGYAPLRGFDSSPPGGFIGFLTKYATLPVVRVQVSPPSTPCPGYCISAFAVGPMTGVAPTQKGSTADDGRI